MTKQFIVNLVESEDGSYPGLSIEEGDYTSYFENEHGEQLIFVYRQSTKAATLYHSDCNWEDYTVVDAKVPEIEINMDERFWLTACWWAITGEAPSWIAGNIPTHTLPIGTVLK